MKLIGQKLQIRVYETNGAVTSYDQNDPEIARAILESFDPEQVFNQETLVIADKRSHSTFPVSQIARIDFTSGSNPPLVFRGEMVEAMELTKAQFDALIRNPIMGAQWQRANSADKSIVVFLEVSLAGGESLLLTMDIEFRSFPNFNEIREHLLQRSGLCLRMQEGGIAVINLANLTRLTFFPGSTDSPGNAWPASFSQRDAAAVKDRRLAAAS
jgi:hypothetical protein